MLRACGCVLLALSAITLPGCSDDNGVLDPGGDFRWMAIEPTQCGGSPWESAGQSFGEFVEQLPDPTIDTSIERNDLGTCLACSCPTGERHCIRTGPGNVQELLDAGFGADAGGMCAPAP